jgi:hypothetical protein
MTYYDQAMKAVEHSDQSWNKVKEATSEEWCVAWLVAKDARC